MLARSDDGGQSFRRLYDFSDCQCPRTRCTLDEGTNESCPAPCRFVNVSPVVVRAGQVPGLPAAAGDQVLLFGTGMYRRSHVYLAVVPLDAGWDDLGSWDAAARIREREGRDEGPHVRIDSGGSHVFADAGRVVIVGAPGIVVARSGPDVLVVARGCAEGVKAAAAAVRAGGQPRRSRRKSRSSRS